ncbi:Uma2 family endonuclease [Tumidithrix helvetica PCC 7403]|uniref:Uma2 family endonuclease n=1 Tax=Tumidithrix helvetica TaxID=3457545 RepID=UPI003C91BD98
MLSNTKRFTLEEYHRLIDLRFFAEGDRIELVRGEIVQMAPKTTSHVFCSRSLLDELPSLLQGRAKFQCQDPILLPSGSEPEPDFVIINPKPDNYLSGHPTPADILLVIEVADSSLDYDQTVKAELYAEAGISNYWLFNLVDYRLEAYSEPYKDFQGEYGYAQRKYILAERSAPLPFAPDAPSLDLSKVFPRLVDYQSFGT